jgi:DNA-binding protein WhiA
MNEIFGFDCIVEKNNSRFSVHINDGDLSAKVISAVGNDKSNSNAKTTINPHIVASTACKRAYIRSSFLCCGSVTNPEKQYHLEFVNVDCNHALALKELIADFDIEAKIIERKNHFVVYLKEGEQIVDVLNIISAHKALMIFENHRILKEIRNKTNRIVNCETANINKTVSAAEKQREAIEYISETIGLDKLQPALREAARARLIYPFVSLKELGENMVPPVGKSGVNHRLKRICEIAEKLKGEIDYD